MLRRIDAFAKPREDLRQKSALGGIITLAASIAAVSLFLGQIYLYITGVTRHSLHLSQSQWFPVPKLDAVGLGRGGHIPFKLHVSFPHLTCSRLDLAHDAVSYTDPKFQAVHGWNVKVSTRALTRDEWQKATGQKRSNPSVQDLNDGCTFIAHYEIPKVGGIVSVGLSAAAWSEASTFLIMGLTRGVLNMGKTPGKGVFNTTHFIHSIEFGEMFPLTKNPLQDDMHVVENDSGGIALANVNVKLVPTLYSGMLTSREMYQLSVTEHIVQPETLAQQGSRFLPGLALSYDFTPLAVHHVEARDNILVFLSSLVSIVGGVFVTVSLVTGCLVHSAAELAKKID